jgi:hypothetical protein
MEVDFQSHFINKLTDCRLPVKAMGPVAFSRRFSRTCNQATGPAAS